MQKVRIIQLFELDPTWQCPPFFYGIAVHADQHHRHYIVSWNARSQGLYCKVKVISERG